MPIYRSNISRTTVLENIREVYTFEKVIGHGHFGTVRLALHKKSGINYAIKSIPKDKIKENIHLLKRELEILMESDHPNIIKLYETYEDQKYFHLVNELCTGGELFERIRSQGAYSEAMAADIMRKLLSAIKHLHDMHIVHRDLKPENFLFENN